VRVQRAMAPAALLWSVPGWRVVWWARSYGTEDLFNSLSAPTIRAASSGNEAAKSAGTVGGAQRGSESWRCALGDARAAGISRVGPLHAPGLADS
jgi:hypothetical protein